MSDSRCACVECLFAGTLPKASRLSLTSCLLPNRRRPAVPSCRTGPCNALCVARGSALPKGAWPSAEAGVCTALQSRCRWGGQPFDRVTEACQPSDGRSDTVLLCVWTQLHQRLATRWCSSEVLIPLLELVLSLFDALAVRQLFPILLNVALTTLIR